MEHNFAGFHFKITLLAAHRWFHFKRPRPDRPSLFSLGACTALSIGGATRGIRLLGVSMSKNFIAFVYSDSQCSQSNFLLSFGGQARGDCPADQVFPSSNQTVVSGTSVYFAAKVPGSTSSSYIACMCKCASYSSVVGTMLGCSDTPASQCGGAYCAATYPGQCKAHKDDLVRIAGT